ncbi:hypothetical protein MRQ36_04915 [Micromonospora sp. R77]|uniref:hypothetical protein n=1 Tax=Micromonospora sp. R77 TaxID=2925836 RepID=UPI001F6010E7|nr:hypothetical protein [Micromonospora sp. R77]MCI4061941.1 hypothetical protein [Micromonospora sp. R77]
MIRTRVLPILLTGFSLVALAACGDKATDSTAAATPTASASATAAAAPTTSAAATPAAAAIDDKQLCENAKKANASMKAKLVETMTSGSTPAPSDFAKILTGLEKEMSAVAATGAPDSEVTAGLTAFAKEAGKAAAAADPASAADNPEFMKAGATLSAACGKAGVTVVF